MDSGYESETVDILIFELSIASRLLLLPLKTYSPEHSIYDRMMALSKEEIIELVLLSGREEWSYRKIAEEFNLRHPYSL
ncbi:Hypothetical predicted protein [Octopus vulgaris]|uniref:Uncharacterized protein n=1 Tax=Octopus vulgaris TaxID=6645 RepID=A0AA36BMC1_OCTVU|nr:Hypothetical predicted protein [Octopus vulgaris]